MIRIGSADGESRAYVDVCGKLHVVNLTRPAAEQLAALGLPRVTAEGLIPLPAQPRRANLGQVAASLEDLSSASLDELWDLHDGSPSSGGSTSNLRIKLELARRLARPCVLCHLNCRADRERGEGWCRAPSSPTRADPVLHIGEEVVGPTLCLYLGPGCSHRCRFCTMHELIEASPGTPLEAKVVADTLAGWQVRGARSLTLIGGEPGIYLPWVLELLLQDRQLPLVWNSNMYHTPDVARLLKGVVDVYIADFKFGSDACARKLAGVADYVAPVLSNLASAWNDGAVLLVRHVVMPGHLECCTRPVLEKVAAHLPSVPVHLMPYIPEWKGPAFGLKRFTEDTEIVIAKAWAESLHLAVYPEIAHSANAI